MKKRYLLLLLALALLAPVALLLLQPRWQPLLLEYLVETFTDMDLVLEAPAMNLWRGTARADRVALYPLDHQGLPLISMQQFSASLGNPRLRTDSPPGSLVAADSIQVYVSQQDGVPDPSPRDWLAYLGWVPERIEVRVLHLINTATNTRVLPLRGLSGRRLDGPDYRVTAEADYTGKPLAIELSVAALEKDEQRYQMEGTLEVRTHDGGVVQLDGVLHGSAEVFSYQVALESSFTAIEEILLANDSGLQLAGNLSLNGDVRGDTGGFTIDRAVMTLDNMPVYGFEAAGNLHYDFSGDSEMQLQVAGEMNSMAQLANWIDLDFVELGKAQANLTLSGSLRAPVVDHFILLTRNPSGLQLKLSGALDPGIFRGQQPARSSEVRVDLSAPDLASVARWTGELDFEPGPWSASGVLRSDGHSTALEELLLAFGGLHTVQIRGQGRLADIATLAQAAPSALPDMALQLALSAPDTAVMGDLFGLPIPALPGFGGRARLVHEEQRWSLQDIAIAVESDSVYASASGSIADLAEMESTHLDVTVHSASTNFLLAALGERFQYLPGLGRLHGSFEVSLSRRGWQLEDIALAAADDSPLQIRARGYLHRLPHEPEGSFTGTLEIDDKLLLEQLSGLRLQPLNAAVSTALQPGRADTNASVRLGATQFTATASILHAESKIRGLSLAVDSAHLDLNDVGLQATGTDESGAPGYRPATQLRLESSPQQVEKLLSQSPAYPLDVRLSLAGLTGDNTSLDGLDLHVTGADNRYMIRDFSLHYDQAIAQFRGVIDLGGRPPFMSIATDIRNLSLNRLSRDIGLDIHLEGNVSALGGLTGRGYSLADIVQSMDGTMALAAQDMVFDGPAYDLLATDLLAWVYTGAASETSTRLNCIMGRFTLAGGVAASDSLFIDSARMAATGKAKIDFPADRLMVELTPRSKSRVIHIPAEVRIKGPITAPKVHTSTLAAAADAYAKAIDIIPTLTMKIFGIQRNQTTAPACTPQPPE